MPLKHKVSIGDMVQWTVKPEYLYRVKPFKAKGTVLKIKMSTFGGQKRKLGASIEVSTKLYHSTFGKKVTFIALDNVTVLN